MQLVETLALTPDGKGLNWRGYLFLVVLCLCFYLPGLATLPPTDRDESFFAQATKQMVETHDYVDINFLGTPRYKKPVGIYWLQTFAVRALNPDHLDEIWAYRVPSVLGAVIAVLLTAALGALLFDGATGLVAGIMLASCLDLTIEAHLAKTDASLLGSVMAAQYALARAYLRPTAGWKNAFLFWTALGIGILLKGPIILLIVCSTLLWIRCTEKKLDWFRRLKPWVGILYTLLLIMPWFIAINLASHGRFTEQAGGHDFLGKLWQGQDRGFLPPGVHLAWFPVFFFPFSLFAILAIPDAWKQRSQPAVRFCIGWIVPTWIVFEISSTKLPQYILPAFPAIAILTAKIFREGFPSLGELTRHWRPTLTVTLWVLIGMSFAIALAALPVIFEHQIDQLQIVSSFIFLIAQGAGLLLFIQGRKIPCIIALASGALIFSGIAFSSTVPELHRLWIAREIVDEARSIAPCPKLSLVSAGYQEPSLAFLAGTGTKLVPNGTYAAGEMQYDRCRVGVIAAPLLRPFLNSFGDFPLQPVPMGKVIEGINTGHGSGTQLYLYVMPPNADQNSGLSMKIKPRIVICIAAFLVFEIALILFVDRPVSDWMRRVEDAHPAVTYFFRMITDFATSKWYLWPSAIGIFVCWMQLRSFTATDEQRVSLARIAHALTFLFASIALSGIVTDIIKPIIGRARPVMAQRDQIYTFDPINFHAAWNSMPSGHATTAGALATVLILLLPRGRILWIALALLLASSRIIVNAHYLSDVIAGFAIGVLMALYVARFRDHQGMFQSLKGIFPIDKKPAEG